MPIDIYIGTYAVYDLLYILHYIFIPIFDINVGKYPAHGFRTR